jgi:hypothetical protein
MKLKGISMKLRLAIGKSELKEFFLKTEFKKINNVITKY